MAKPHILIIEDDPILGEVYMEILARESLEAELIRDGTVAKQRLQEVVPHLILLDLHLPHVSGMELVQQIKGDERLQNTAVVLLTADGLRARDLEDHADLVLLKPVSYQQLYQLTKRFLESI